MIKLKSLLLETHLEDLFHATGASELLQILQDDSLKLSFAGGNSADMRLNKGYHFFLSTMRQKYGNWARGFTTTDNKFISQNVVINLNGRNLTAAGFRVFHVDYWGAGRERSEQEERIVSNKDEISPLNSFVKEIHVFVNITKISPHYVERFHKISDLAKNIKIPIYFYMSGNEEYFKSQRTEKAVRSLDNILPQPEWTPDDLEHKKWLSTNKINRDGRDTQKLRIFLDIYYEKEVDTENYPGNRVREWLLYHPHDAYAQIECDIHNIKKDHPPIFREFVSIMKKEGFKTTREFIAFVIQREQKKEKIRRDKEADEKGWRR